MRNLLTDTQKKRIREEYIMRLSGVSLWFCALLGLMGVLSLLPTYFFVTTQNRALAEEYRVLQSSIPNLEVDGGRSPLILLRQKMEVLSAERLGKRMTEVLGSILESKAASIHISGFFYSKQPKEGQLEIRGVADDRESLLAFKRSLELSERFSSVNLPIESLARERNLEFELQLTGTF